MRMCPICGRKYDEYPAISRMVNYTEICPSCGLKEALSIFFKESRDERNIYTAYSQEADITFIMEDKEQTASVVGFYCGEPNDSATVRYYGSLTAEYE